MTKTAKIAISLPEELLQDIEEERRASGQSRSEFFRRVAEAFLRRQRERALDEQYIRAYREHPETEEEIAMAESTMRYAFLENPWEHGDHK